MKRVKRVRDESKAITFPIVVFIVTAIFAGVQGCGNTDGPYSGNAYFTCAQPLIGRTDDYGHPDPCCNLKACCPSPDQDHFSKDEFGHKYWDPCCLTEDCPGANVWKVPPSMGSGGAGGAGASPDGSDGSSDAHACAGKCVPAAPLGFTGPVYLWEGPADQVPSCPKEAPFLGWLGKSDFQADKLNCPACTCDPPGGECGMPGKIMASSGLCNVPGPHADTDFSGSTNWTGECTPENAIPAGALCNGKPCVKSLSISPLVMSEGSCSPRSDTVQPPAPPAWGGAAIACQARDYAPCDGEANTCVPALNPPSDKFRTCVAAFGEDFVCPTAFPDRRVYYEDAKDTRACSECTCSKPEGSQCTGALTVFQDAACKGPLVAAKLLSSDPTGSCVDGIPTGVSLGSKAMTGLTFKPGTCMPQGGVVVGEAKPTGAVTFCCLQP